MSRRISGRRTMKKSYIKPTLDKREKLSLVTAGGVGTAPGGVAVD